MGDGKLFEVFFESFEIHLHLFVAKRSGSPKKKGSGGNSSNKRKFEELSEDKSGIEQLIQASNARLSPLLVPPPAPPALTTSSSSSSAVGVDGKSNLNFYPPDEAELLTVLDPMIQAYNIYDMEEFYNLLSQKCTQFMTLKLKYFDYTVVGIHPVLIFCNITHECYPDAMLKVLERRIVNLTAPHTEPATSVDSELEKGNDGSSSSTSPSHQVPPSSSESDIKLEFICKFYGTIIAHQDVAKICQEFLSSSHNPSLLGDLDIANAMKDAAEGKFPLPPSSDSKVPNLASIAGLNAQAAFGLSNQINEKKLEDLSMDLARFISSNYLPEASDETTTNRQASYFIIELVCTLDSERKRIIHTDMDILAASEHLTTFNKLED